MAATMGDLFSAGNCTERVTGVIEHALELGVAVGEDAAQPPAGAAVEWPDGPTQEVSGCLGRVRGQESGRAVRPDARECHALLAVHPSDAPPSSRATRGR
jgi:hypothetical protein